MAMGTVCATSGLLRAVTMTVSRPVDEAAWPSVCAFTGVKPAPSISAETAAPVQNRPYRIPRPFPG